MNLKQMDLNELKQYRGKVLERLVEASNSSDLDEAARIAASGLETELSDVAAEIRAKEGRAAEDREQALRHINARKPGGGYETGVMLAPSQSVRSYMADHGMIRSPEFDDLRPGALLRAMVTGARTDIERRALAEGSDSTGGVSVPAVTLARIIDAMRAAQVCMRLGAQTVMLTTDSTTIARTDSDPVPEWRSESGGVAESDPSFSGVVLTPRSLAVIFKASRELLEDSINIETAIEASLTGALAVELDRVALRGSGTPPEPRGIVNTSGINTRLGSPLADYDDIVSGMVECWIDNSPVVNGIVMSPANLGYLALLKEATTLAPLAKPPVLANIPMLATTSMDDDTLILGDFTKLIFGIRAQLRIEVLRELFAENMQYGFLCHLRADVAVEHPVSFCKVTNLTVS